MCNEFQGGKAWRSCMDGWIAVSLGVIHESVGIEGGAQGLFSKRFDGSFCRKIGLVREDA